MALRGPESDSLSVFTAAYIVAVAVFFFGLFFVRPAKP
jgi:hypothetical protein